MTDQFTQEQRDVAAKVAKLLDLAGRNPNEHEASAAAEKANQLLLEYNLSMSVVDQARSQEQSGRREQAKQRGGMYLYQRDLWRTVADLNFCLYFTRRVKTEKNWSQAKIERKGRNWTWAFHHAVIGRVVNVQATVALATYLEEMIERLCKERLHGREDVSQGFFSRWAVSYREGVAERVIQRLRDRRDEQVAEAEAKRRADLAKHMDETSVATALTVADLDRQENDLNNDFLHDWEPGTTARRRQENAEREARREAEYTAWAAAHPEEARQKEEEAEKRRRKFWSRYRGGPKERDKDWGAFRAGFDAGADIGLDQQVDRNRVAGRIGAE